MRPAFDRPPAARCPTSEPFRAESRLLFLTAIALLTCNLSGCINAMVMAGKVFFGDSYVMSPFEQRTGVSLSDGDRQVVFVCTAPGSASEEFNTLAIDLQDNVHLQLKAHGVGVADSPELQHVFTAAQHGFDREAIARAAPNADYVLHADVERFSGTEDASPELLRGRASGRIYAYEVHRSSSHAGNPRVLQVFYQDFQCEYPAAHPVSADQVSPRVFHRRFVEHLARLVGRTFYDVPTPDAIR
jgi:hypothetical protein